MIAESFRNFLNYPLESDQVASNNDRDNGRDKKQHYIGNLKLE